jgi:hypothetical protein
MKCDKCDRYRRLENHNRINMQVECQFNESPTFRQTSPSTNRGKIRWLLRYIGHPDQYDAVQEFQSVIRGDLVEENL